MSAPAAHGLIIEHVYTRDFLVPIFAFRQWVGWDCYPVPPSCPMKPNPLWALYHLTEPTHSSVGPMLGLSLRGRAWMDAPLRRARRRSWTCVHLDQFADLWTLQPLADLYFDASALRHAAVSCCLQHTDVNTPRIHRPGRQTRTPSRH